jgi:hypothetical protein
MNKYRKVNLHLAGLNLEGYLSRGEERNRHNTWNGWECPVMTAEQIRKWIPLQNWLREPDPSCVDEISLVEKSGKTILRVYWSDEECSEMIESFEVELRDGGKIDVYSVELGYCWEEGHYEGDDNTQRQDEHLATLEN